MTTQGKSLIKILENKLDYARGEVINLENKLAGLNGIIKVFEPLIKTDRERELLDHLKHLIYADKGEIANKEAGIKFLERDLAFFKESLEKDSNDENPA